MKQYLLLSIIILALPIMLFSQTITPKIDWYKVYDGPGKGVDLTNDIKIDESQNIYLVGRSAGPDSSQDLLILKYSKNGDSTLGLRYISAPHSWDEANSIAIDSKSDIYVVGGATFGQNTFYALFHKYSINGELIWAKNFNSDLNINSTGVQVVLNSKEDAIIGYNRSSAKIGKYSSLGDSLWTVSIYDDTSFYEVNYLAVDKNDNIYAAITQKYWNGGDLPETKIVLVKINNTGEVLWRKQFKGNDVRKTMFDNEDNFILMTTEALIVKINSLGDTLWTRQYPEIGNIVITTDLVVDSNNDIVFTGYGLGDNSWDYFTQKMSSTGQEKWVCTFNSDENLNDFASSLTIDKENNIFVTGGTHNSISVGYCYTVKYSTTGEFKWALKFDAPHSKFENGNKIFVDDSSNIYIGGEVADSINGWNFLALKIKQENSTGIISVDKNIPSNYSLSQNYPNPFNPSTTIRFSVPKQSHIRIEVVNTVGQHIATVINETRDAGNYEVSWQANISSGMYFYRIEAIDIHNPNNNFVETKKMILLR
ncbi:MAG: T9SS type A sorting domain-containing protein [Bacteriovoracaceae bacterium]